MKAELLHDLLVAVEHLRKPDTVTPTVRIFTVERYMAIRAALDAALDRAQAMPSPSGE